MDLKESLFWEAYCQICNRIIYCADSEQLAEFMKPEHRHYYPDPEVIKIDVAGSFDLFNPFRVKGGPDCIF